MVAMSTPHTPHAGLDFAEGAWRTVTRADHDNDRGFKLWWSADADYDKEATLLSPVEEEAVLQRLLVAPLLSEKRASSLPSSSSEEEEKEEGEVVDQPEQQQDKAPEAPEEDAPPAAKRMRLVAYCSGQQKNWAGAVPSKKACRAPNLRPKTTIMQLRVALPVGLAG
jgi:hypothetical protein